MRAVIATLCFLGFPTPLCAEELTVHWKEVPQSLFDNRKVEVHLQRGAALRGRALALTPEGLRMEITKLGAGGGKYQRGESLVLAGETTRMKVSQTGTRGRIIGTAIGGGISAAIIGIVYGLGLSNIEGTSASPRVAVAALVPTGIGYSLGWARDRRTTTIHVQPYQQCVLPDGSPAALRSWCPDAPNAGPKSGLARSGIARVSHRGRNEKNGHDGSGWMLAPQPPAGLNRNIG